ncbi:MAG: hypothetical protein U1E47_06695 [Rivihabitans pingtungensis]
MDWAVGGVSQSARVQNAATTSAPPLNEVTVSIREVCARRHARDAAHRRAKPPVRASLPSHPDAGRHSENRAAQVGAWARNRQSASQGLIRDIAEQTNLWR